MKQGSLAVLDSDRDYVERLGHYLNESRFMMLKVFIFFSQSKLDWFLEKEKVEVLLVQEALWKDEYAKKNGLVLCEQQTDTPGEIPWIYKYQSARLIGQEIMDFYAKNIDSRAFYSRKKSAEMLAVFPVGNDQVGSIFAWELARNLGKKRQTLYVNLKPFCGMSSRLGATWKEDLSDCIYFLRKGKGNLAVKLQALIQKEEEFSYLPPAWSEEDIRSISKEEWRQLLNAICTGLNYETVVLDLWEGAADFNFWLEESNYMFTPLSDDYEQVRALERRKWMENRADEQVLKKWICFFGEGFKGIREFALGRELSISDYVNRILVENGVPYGKI